MNLTDAIKARHSVRQYTAKPIDDEAKAQLSALVDSCNLESGLRIQLCFDEPRAFDSMLARYGKFTGVNNYIALVGPKGPHLEEKCGYHGQRLVLLAQQLGLNTCWVAATYSKGKSPAAVRPGEKLLMVISLGYGATQGVSHKSKPLEAVCKAPSPMPEWFRAGMEAVLLAPTATNQQKFLFTLQGSAVKAEALSGFYAKTDLGIAKLHFEIGAGQGSWSWA